MGVEKSAVRNAIASGRIVANDVGQIEWETQSKAWRDNKDLSRDRTPGDVPTFAAAKVRKENAVASIKELELASAKNQLLEKEQVKQAMFKWARAVRDAVLTMPDRIASEVASQINATLKKEKRAKATDAEVERIVREAWIKESVAVLEAVDKAPEVKGPKAKLKNEAESDDEET